MRVKLISTQRRGEKGGERHCFFSFFYFKPQTVNVHRLINNLTKYRVCLGMYFQSVLVEPRSLNHKDALPCSSIPSLNLNRL